MAGQWECVVEIETHSVVGFSRFQSSDLWVDMLSITLRRDRLQRNRSRGRVVQRVALWKGFPQAIGYDSAEQVRTLQDFCEVQLTHGWQL
jgi:hypothetical protein